jgi:hypothetical protein
MPHRDRSTNEPRDGIRGLAGFYLAFIESTTPHHTTPHHTTSLSRRNIPLAYLLQPVSTHRQFLFSITWGKRIGSNIPSLARTVKESWPHSGHSLSRPHNHSTRTGISDMTTTRRRRRKTIETAGKEGVATEGEKRKHPIGQVQVGRDIGKQAGFYPSPSQGEGEEEASPRHD